MNMFKEVNENIDKEKNEKLVEKKIQEESVAQSIEMISSFFPEIIEGLAERGFKAKSKDKKSLHGKVIEIEGQDSLGLFYYMDSTRKAIAVELNNGVTKLRHDFLYAPSKQEMSLQRYGEDVPVEVILKENYEALVKKLEG